VLVVACDLPLLSGEALATIAGWPGKASVVPVVKGRPQPLCARWSTADIAVAGRLSSAGERSMKSLLDRVIFTALVEADLPSSLGGDVFVDVDSPMDLERLGFSGPAGNIEGLHRQVGP
jgi:molybdopterin-guanine dinucleotide biosynthesis protein A